MCGLCSEGLLRGLHSQAKETCPEPSPAAGRPIVPTFTPNILSIPCVPGITRGPRVRMLGCLGHVTRRRRVKRGPEGPREAGPDTVAVGPVPAAPRLPAASYLLNPLQSVQPCFRGVSCKQMTRVAFSVALVVSDSSRPHGL